MKPAIQTREREPETGDVGVRSKKKETPSSNKVIASKKKANQSNASNTTNTMTKKTPQTQSSTERNKEKKKHHHHSNTEVKSKKKNMKEAQTSSNKHAATTTVVEVDDDDDDDQDMSIMQMARLGYQELVNAIIRPPRATYKMEDLGPSEFEYNGERYRRIDFQLETSQGKQRIECSQWEPTQLSSIYTPFVIYMHGNSSSRTEVIPQCLSFLLTLGVRVVAFDFSGSGKSDGEYVSLGYFEREDLACIVQHIRINITKGAGVPIALWGRSMGAATALLYGERDSSIAGMILDSPFADLPQLFHEMVEKAREQGMAVPGVIASVAIRMLRGSVKKQAGFNMKEVRPIASAPKCKFPALLVAGTKDDFVLPHHSREIFNQYGGKKDLLMVDGTHSTPRPISMFQSSAQFLKDCFGVQGNNDDVKFAVPANVALMNPPWTFPKRENTSTATRRASSGDDNVYDEEQDIGMTTNRQRDIQTSLFKMMGQEDAAPKTVNNST